MKVVKVVTKNCVECYVSLNLQDINKAMTEFLQSQGHRLVIPIKFLDLANFSSSGKLTVGTSKISETKISVSNKVKHDLPKPLIVRVHGCVSGLGIILYSIAEEQANKFILNSFSSLSADCVTLLTFAYNPNHKGGVAKMKDIAKELRLDDPTNSLDVAVRSFANHLYGSLLDELCAGRLFAAKIPINILDMNIDDFPFSVRTYNCLAGAGINTIRILLETKDNNLRKIKNLGKQSIAEIENFKKLYKIIGS